MVDESSRSSQERRERYLRLAAEAHACAAEAKTTELKDAYVALGEAWRMLAAEIDAEA